MINYNQALYLVSKHSTETRRKLNNTTTQRRNSIYNSFGQERSVVVEPNKAGTIYIPITTDISSFINWTFKLVIRPMVGGTVEPITNFKLIIDDIDCTSIFEGQHTLPTGEGIFPNKTTGDVYDIINVCEMLVENQRNKILDSGIHTLKIECDRLVQVTLLEFLSYSFITRGGQPVSEYFKTPVNEMGDMEEPEDVSQPRLMTFSNKDELLLERSQLELGLATVKGSRANQFIESAISATRINEIDKELNKIEKLEDLQNGGK